MAVIAGAGGLAAIVFSIAFPIWAARQGRPYTPAFSLFAAWGVAALAGAYACVRTYLISGIEPPPRPRGGVRPIALRTLGPLPPPVDAPAEAERRAA